MSDMKNLGPDVSREKPGALVYPINHTIENLAMVYLHSIATGKKKDVCKALEISEETPTLEVYAQAVQIFQDIQDENKFVQYITKLSNHRAIYYEGESYILPGEGHNGVGFYSLKVGDDVEYKTSTEDTEWKRCIVMGINYTEDGKVEMASGYADPFLIRKPRK
jgi:hypothetical protein